jgi:vacuolar-type H+-ATPase subunit E/Vma4
MRDDVSQLLAAIKETADAEKAEMRAQTDQEITKINEHRKAQIDQFRDEKITRLDAQLQMESECIVGRAQLEIRDRLIAAKNEALRDVFNLVNEKIAELYDSETYKEIFKRLVSEAINRANCNDMVLRISKTDLPIFESLKGDLPASISVMPLDSPKGTVVVEIDGGSQSFDNSIETRIKTAQDLMRTELVKILFDGDTSGDEDK